MAIFDLLHKLWEKLNLRGVMMLSLSLQVCLVLLAPLRKRGVNRMYILLTWSAYLMADLVADYALGLLAKGRKGDSRGPAADSYTDLFAFWAPFLLVHLGGPDNITAFTLEDNELWMRHFLNLLFQLGIIGYVFYQSLPGNKLMLPTILIFIDGLIKYVERTRSLYKASFRKFRDSMDHAKLMEDNRPGRGAGTPAKREGIPRPNDIESSSEDVSVVISRWDDIRIIENAHYYFTTFRVLLVDLLFTTREHYESRAFFSNTTAEDAFKVIEVELNFIYDVLYTKAAVIRSKCGYFFRAISFISTLTALALFHSSPKHDLHEYDIRITYVLLIGAISMDIVALTMLILSNWTVATISGKFEEYLLPKRIFVKSFLELNSWSKCVLRDRWYRTVLRYNFLDQCLKKHHTGVYEWFDVFLEDLRPVFGYPFSEGLRVLIFDEVKEKADHANTLENIKKMCKVRGEWVLQQHKVKHGLDCSELLPFVCDVEYGESLLLWHIATELCYSIMSIRRGTSVDPNPMRTNSKILSDYMLYLLIKQPNMVSTVSGITLLRYRYTCEKTKKFFKNELFGRMQEEAAVRRREGAAACFNLFFERYKEGVDSELSFLLKACKLAHKLQDFEERKWEIMSRVWVELLAHAAIHCRPYSHAQQLGKGGELVSFVWLLMVQLGLSDQFKTPGRESDISTN